MGFKKRDDDDFVPHKKDSPVYLWLLVGAVLVVGGLAFYANTQTDTGFTGAVTTGAVVGNVAPGDVGTVPLTLAATPVPDLTLDVELSSLEVTFNSFNVPFTVNKEGLNVRGKEAHTLVLEGYSGKFGLTQQGVVLQGTASRVILDNVMLGTQKALAIQTRGLAYNELHVRDSVLGRLRFQVGDGTMDLRSGKVIYALDDEEVELSDFGGDLYVDKDGFGVTGVVRDVNLNGALVASIS